MAKKNMFEVAVARENRRALRGRKPLTTERELGNLAFREGVSATPTWPKERKNGWWWAAGDKAFRMGVRPDEGWPEAMTNGWQNAAEEASDSSVRLDAILSTFPSPA